MLGRRLLPLFIVPGWPSRARGEQESAVLEWPGPSGASSRVSVEQERAVLGWPATVARQGITTGTMA